MNSNAFLYFHGGPGLNSLAEQHLLGPLFADYRQSIFFWNEPSKFRPSGDLFSTERAYSALTASMHRFVKEHTSTGHPAHVILHSFAVNPFLQKSIEEPQRIASLTIIAPAFDFWSSLRRIVGLAISDFEADSPGVSRQLEQCLKDSKKPFDAKMREAIQLAATDAKLFTNYWRNTAAMNEYFGCWQERGAQLDLDSFFSVLTELATITTARADGAQIAIPTKLIFGKHDPIIDAKKETLLTEKIFSSGDYITFENSAHYPHLEEAKRFVSLMCE